MSAAGLRTLLSGSVVEAARGLLGSRLRTQVGGAVTEVVLTEVEAYDGANDPASHAYRGRTARNQVMFGPPGHLYVYRSYGIHWCMNVVVGEPGRPAAVLLRAGRPTAGLSIITARRGRGDHLTDGPGKLSQALGVAGEHDGLDLLGRQSPVRILPGESPIEIATTPRVGISKAQKRPWRFLVASG